MTEKNDLLLNIVKSVIVVLFCMAATTCGLEHTSLKQLKQTPRKQSELEYLFKITWNRGPNLPQGFQDSDGGIIGDMLITVGGFCGGKNESEKPGIYPRGFLKKVWGLDLRNPESGWVEIPEFPGAARQELFSIVVDQELYCWGGFNYDSPYTYKDGYKLSGKLGSWKWTPLPSLPYPVASSGICAIGSKIYVFGGADYDFEKFYAYTDRIGGNTRLGAHLHVIDTRHIESGWRLLEDCPGTPRWVSATATVGGKVYVIGGATGSDTSNNAYNTVVDNWVYHPNTDTWKRFRDLPISSGNFPAGEIVYNDRYIVLIGGYQYSMIENPDGSIRKPYGNPYKFYKDKSYFSDVLVYDTQRNSFGCASNLPLNNNLPMAVLRGDQLFLIGGETGGATIEGEYYGFHPELFLTGNITMCSDY